MMKDSFTLFSDDGLHIEGDVWAPSGGKSLPTVVVCHGFQEFKDGGFFPHVAESLARADFAVITFNLSHSGVESSAQEFNRPDLFKQGSVSAELADLASVLRALFDGSLPGSRMFDLGRVALLGHGRGGAVCFLTALQSPRITSLVTWAAPARFLRFEPKEIKRWRKEGQIAVRSRWSGQEMELGLDFLHDLDEHEYNPLKAINGLPIPCLIMHGQADEVIPPSEAEELYEAGPSEGVEALWIQGADHDFGASHPFKGTTEALEQAIAFSREFLQDTLF